MKHARPSATQSLKPWGQLLAVIGEEAGDQLSKAFGGRMLYVPTAPGAHHPITVVIGAEKAAALGKAYGGVRFDIPVAAGKRAAIVELDGKQWTRADIAKHLRCTERHVYKVLADEKIVRPREPDLFT